MRDFIQSTQSPFMLSGMDNPYETPILALGFLAGLAAGLIPGNQPIRWLNRLYIILSAACGCWMLVMFSTDWAYTHPFKPSDAARVGAALLGWAVALIYPILPTFFAVSLLRVLCTRHFSTRSAT